MKYKISFPEALNLVMKNMPPGRTERVGLSELTGRVLAEDAVARVDSPSVDASLKDGYAVHSAEVAAAAEDRPVSLSLVRFQAAGDSPGDGLAAGAAVRVTTGAPLPPGADAVLAGEFAREEDGTVWCLKDAGQGRNVLARGTDVRAGDLIARAGDVLTPGLVGLLAAAGWDAAEVVALPRVALIGTGDEVLAPGQPLQPGRLYASNIVETQAWLRSFGITDTETRVLPDKADRIAAAVRGLMDRTDVFVTSGGAWGSEKDLMIGLLADLGWEGLFHRVRLGPGKAVGFGLLKGRPFFILPGGPPSHEAAFLLLALPGILSMSGRTGPVFPTVNARLTKTVEGQYEWTQVIHALIEADENGEYTARPLKTASRLSSMAGKNALILLPEGTSRYETGTRIDALALQPV